MEVDAEWSCSSQVPDLCYWSSVVEKGDSVVVECTLYNLFLGYNEPYYLMRITARNEWTRERALECSRGLALNLASWSSDHAAFDTKRHMANYSSRAECLAIANILSERAYNSQ